MRFRGLVVIAALLFAAFGAACGQQAAVSTQTSSAPAGLSLSFDALHSQLTAGGYAVKAHPNQVTGTSSVNGTLNITVTINIVSKFQRGTRIPCAAILIGGEVDSSVPLVDGGIETAGGVAAVDWKTKTATCTLSIPYEWTLATDASATEGIIVGFAAAGVGFGDVTERSTIQLGGPLPLPASGATTTLAFTTTL
jgi:hypothetical protein